MEMFLSRHTFFLWPYMVSCGALQWPLNIRWCWCTPMCHWLRDITLSSDDWRRVHNIETTEIFHISIKNFWSKSRVLGLFTIILFNNNVPLQEYVFFRRMKYGVCATDGTRVIYDKHWPIYSNESHLYLQRVPTELFARTLNTLRDKICGKPCLWRATWKVRAINLVIPDL